MAELYDLFNGCFSRFGEIEKTIEQLAKRSMLSSKEALTLIIIGNYKVSDFLIDKNFINVLCKKGLIEYTDNEFKVTSKGAIIIKSLMGALNKF